MATRRMGGTGRGGGFSAWLHAQLTRRPRPLWLVCAAHVVALGLALVLYALPHHVIPRAESAVGVVSSRGAEVQSAEADADLEGAEAYLNDEEANSGEEALAEAEAQPEAALADGETAVETVEAPAAEDSTEASSETGEAEAQSESGADGIDAEFGAEAVGSFRRAFEGVFTSGGVEKTENSYRSENISVSMLERYVDEIRAQVYVVDIYVADISCLTTAFSQDRYGRGYTEWITDVAERYKSVVTMNGDYYGSRSTGVIIRNGELYRDRKYKGDIAVLYWDGHMEAFKSSKFDTMTEMNKGAYQSWSFGPSLLDDSGKPKSDFNVGNSIRNKHPRSAIGYFEPGHYCFVAVDGRNDVSKGATLTQLATLMSNLGCKLAYNLDGGQTSLLALGGKLLNRPSQGGRDSSDYIMIVDRITQ